MTYTEKLEAFLTATNANIKDRANALLNTQGSTIAVPAAKELEFYRSLRNYARVVVDSGPNIEALLCALRVI